MSSVAPSDVRILVHSRHDPRLLLSCSDCGILPDRARQDLPPARWCSRLQDGLTMEGEKSRALVWQKKTHSGLVTFQEA